jgi:hypothetical protein
MHLLMSLSEGGKMTYFCPNSPSSFKGDREELKSLVRKMSDTFRHNYHKAISLRLLTVP